MSVRSVVRYGLMGALVVLLLLRVANHAGWIEPSSSPLIAEGPFWFLAALVFELARSVSVLNHDVRALDHDVEALNHDVEALKGGVKDLRDDVKNLIDDVRELKD